MKRLAAVLLLAAVLAACGGSDEPAATTTTASSSTTTEAPSTTAAPKGPDLGAVQLSLVKIGTFDQPLAMTWCASATQAFVAEKTGKVKTLDGRTTVLDISDGISSSSEQGLLGIACAPDSKHLYAAYTDKAGDERLDEYPLAGNQADRSKARTLVAIPDPAPNHNGGGIAFGPDGKLWYGVGDGGGANDQFDNAQKSTDLLGDMLRVDPAGGKPEVVVIGLRNPWRWSFDRITGDLWIGDVGQGTIEEIDKLTPGQIQGANMGWPAFEGTNRFRKDVAAPPGAIPPVFQYDHSVGQAVVGGYVYRGSKIPAMIGAYLFADTYQGVLRLLAVDGTKVVDQRDLQLVPGKLVSSFAEDPSGELYVLSLAGGVYRLDPG